MVLGGLALGLAACTGEMGRGGNAGQDAGITVPDGASGAAFVAPKELVSADGRLEVTLVAAAGDVPWGAGVRFATTYNGTVPGPTLRVRPGDTLAVTLQNDLAAPTNLHTHGLHVSPEGDSDNILVMVGSGELHTYTYEIPDDHPSGTFWYHPHHHGLVAAQLSGGMAGVIVVEDDLDELPGMADSVERVIVLSDPAIGATDAVLSVNHMQQMVGREGDVVLVNGMRRPVIEASAGGTERWRLVNASASRYYRLSIDAPMHLVASDHGRLAAPVEVSDLLLTPGQRAEVLVPLAAAGTFTLRTAAVDRGGMGNGMGGSVSGADDLLTLRVTASTTGDVPPALPVALRRLDPVDALTVDRSRTFTLGGMGMGAGAFTIDGKSFDVARIDTTAALDTIEEWTLVNASMMDHPFHLHVWPMRVVARADGGDPDPGWRDTVNVPAGQQITVRIAFHDIGGTAVYHCHILDHEDMGMMGVIRVE